MPRKEYIAWFDMPADGKLHGQSVMPKQELIRCKDCKYAIKQYITNLPWLTQWEYSCRYYNTHSVMGDDWCSRAERKEE